MEIFENQFDLIIIGAGVTGLAAAMYAGRLNLKTLVLGSTSDNEFPVGGVITLTDFVQNYPGFKKISGQDLAKKIQEHALEYPHVEVREERVDELHHGEGCFYVKTGKQEYQSKAIIFATGTRWRKLYMPGAVEFEKRGVHYCALCDGPLYQDKNVAVIGGGDSAVKEALLLSQYASKVYIIHRGEKIMAEPENIQNMKKDKKIEVLLNTNVIEILGNQFVNKVKLNRKYNGKYELDLDAVFGAIGHIPLSDLAKDIGVGTTESGEIRIDRDSKTNVEGVFAAGDVVDSTFKQAITGVAQGVTAAHSAYVFIKDNSFVCTTHDPVYID